MDRSDSTNPVPFSMHSHTESSGEYEEGLLGAFRSKPGFWRRQKKGLRKNPVAAWMCGACYGLQRRPLRGPGINGRG